MIKKYGADATRMSLIIGTGPGNDMKLSEDKIKGYKNFSNKLWNITRFVLSAAAGERYGSTNVPAVAYEADFKNYSESEKTMLKTLNDLLVEVTGEMDEYKFYLVGEKLYHYIWHEFADKIIEESKVILSGDDLNVRTACVQFLLHVLNTSLKAIHPFMPYVTEEIWQEVNGGKSLLIVEAWPNSK